jgi:hypothetical protein
MDREAARLNAAKALFGVFGRRGWDQESEEEVRRPGALVEGSSAAEEERLRAFRI